MAEDDFDDDDFDEIVNQIDEEEKRKNKAPISWSSIQVSPGQTENPVLQVTRNYFHEVHVFIKKF